MKPVTPSLADANDHVTRLIETLHNSGRRLEDLTAGEVDAVTDRGGRTFLLRRAQDKLRQSEAAKQAAILDSLPAHIALIDMHGRISSTNAAWGRFPCADVPQGAGHEVGLNYLGTCDRAQGGNAADAHQIAEGIRAVLAGGVDSFSLEYSCRSPTNRYWFQLTVTPLGNDPPTGAVVMHLDITERKRRDEELLRFGAAMDATADAIYLVDRTTMRFVHINAAACRMQGKTREEVLELGPTGVLGIPQAELERNYDAVITSGVAAEPLEMLRPRKDGAQAWVEVRRHAQRSGDGWMIVTLVRDITERKLAEEENLRKKNFIAVVLDSLPGLFYVINDRGRFLRWNRNFEVVSGNSSEEIADLPPLHFFAGADKESVAGTISKVFANGHGTVEADFVAKDQTRTTHFFTGKLVQIEHKPCLIGMGIDISRRKQAEQSLRESERRFSDMLANVELISVMLDCKGQITYCNDYLSRLTGWRPEEVVGQDWFEFFIPPEDSDLRESFFQALIADAPGTSHHENEILTRSHARRLIRWNNSVLRSGAGEVIGTASIGEDITDQKLAEEKIKRLNRVYAVLSGINTLIVRVRDREELFREACKIAFEAGQFRFVWIGIANRETQVFDSVASAGDQSYASLVRPTAGREGSRRAGLAATAMATKKHFLCNDIEADREAIQHPTEALLRGYRSGIALPLIVDGEAIGALVLYAGEPDFFDEQEIALLDELAGDISFALDHLDKQARLDYLAYYDELTGLANRSLFLERVAQYVRSAATGGHKLALYLLDLERFRNINDSLGRPAGDELLKQVAEWLTRSVGDASLLARVGADHFAVVLPEVRQGGNVAQLIELSREAFLNHSFHLNDTVFRIAAKVGVALFPDDGSDADTLLKNAEAALKKAKATGERYLFYTQAMTEKVAGRLTLENQLRRALDQGEFVLHYQPKVNLASGRITSVEALIRWDDPHTGLVPPGRFIPVLEETGLIYEVGRWALHQALADYLRWRAAGLPAVRVAVNVSPLQLRNRDFVDEIARAVGIDAQAPAGLELEITESLIMENVETTIASLRAIRAMGVSIAIDDFGTGFSSLSYLSKLPVDTLKIDRSFVIEMTVAAEGLALVSTIIGLAHAFKLKVVAEGVETEEQSRLLRLLNCDEIQGYLFSKPLPADIFEAKFLIPDVSAKKPHGE